MTAKLFEKMRETLYRSFMILCEDRVRSNKEAAYVLDIFYYLINEEIEDQISKSHADLYKEIKNG
jgi:hypothetical protein